MEQYSDLCEDMILIDPQPREPIRDIVRVLN